MTSPNRSLSPDAAAAALAVARHGILALAELQAAGLDRFAAARRARAGQLHRMHPGVYSLVPPELLAAEGHWLAAVRAGGGQAALSHWHATALWGMWRAPAGAIHISVPGRGGRRRRRGLVIHRPRTLRPDDVAVRRGIPVTTVSRTLRDMQRVLPPLRFGQLLRRAEKLRLDTGRFGPGEDVDATEIERRLLALCRRHSIPRPRTQVIIGPYTVDFLWGEARLIVETDGYATHGTRSAFEDDRARDAWLTANGYRVVRFTWRQLRDDPAEAVRVLRSILGS